MKITSCTYELLILKKNHAAEVVLSSVIEVLKKKLEKKEELAFFTEDKLKSRVR